MAAVNAERIRPLSDWLLVRPDERPDRTEAGLALPEQHRPLPDKGTVLACGPGRTLENGAVVIPQVKPGDRVVFATPLAGLRIDGGLLMMRESEVIGVLDG